MFLVIDHGGKHVTGLVTVASHGKNQFRTLHRQTHTPLHRDILHYVITILSFFSVDVANSVTMAVVQSIWYPLG